VDVKQATYTNAIGQRGTDGLVTDPAFDPKQNALYYVRVLEIPTPRWTTYDAAARPRAVATCRPRCRERLDLADLVTP